MRVVAHVVEDFRLERLVGAAGNDAFFVQVSENAYEEKRNGDGGLVRKNAR